MHWWLQGKDLFLRDKITNSQSNDLFICSIVKAELLYGAKKSQNRSQNEIRLQNFFSQINSLIFDDESAEHYGIIRTTLEQAGNIVGAHDMMIAAIAFQHRLTGVTRNSREFDKITALQVEVWGKNCS